MIGTVLIVIFCACVLGMFIVSVATFQKHVDTGVSDEEIIVELNKQSDE